MELDEETYFALSCQSSWDMWEFAVALHTVLLERRQAVRERVEWHRRVDKALKRERERLYHEKNKEARNAARRAAAALARDLALARGERTPEQIKWERRRARERANGERVLALIREGVPAG